MARILLVTFVVIGFFFWSGWLIWAFLILLLGLKHPPIFDENVPLSRSRKILGLVVLCIFILSFVPDPIKGYSLVDIAKQFLF
jgi:hypothetical protein